MNKLMLLRNYINDNSENIQNGTRESVIALLKSFCEENNVLSYDDAYEAHYLFIGEAEDPESLREQAVEWIQQAHCSEGGKGHSFQTVFVAPTIDKDGFKISVCVQGGDAFYYEETSAYGEDYSGQVDSGFYCSQLILDTDSDFSCFLPETEKTIDEFGQEEISMDDVEENIETEAVMTETNIPQTVRNHTNSGVFIALGILIALFIACAFYYFKITSKKVKKNENRT